MKTSNSNRRGRDTTRTSCLPRLVTKTVLGATVCYALKVGAATLSWSGGGASGNWSDSGNWGFAGTPANGDTLIFSAAQPRLSNTNNIASLTLNQIRFVGAGGGYAIFGNAFTLTNSIQATNTAGGNALNNNMTLAVADVTVNVGAVVSLTLGGALSGSLGIIKSGTGTLQLAGTAGNSFSGTTTVNAGTLELNKTGSDADAIAGPLVIGDGTGGVGADVVRSLIGANIGGVPIRINSSGLLDLNGFGDTIGSLTLNGGDVTTGAAGLLALSGNFTNLASGASISGNFSLGGATRIFNISASLTISAVISDGVLSGAGINQIGPGQWTLSGANTFTGPMTVSGFLIVANDSALGANGSLTNGTKLNENAFLLVQGATVGNEFLTLTNSDDFRSSGTASWAGPISLTGDVDINVFGGSFTLSGAITGSGGVTKGQTGTLIYSGGNANTYAGSTIVNTGILQLSKPSGVAIFGSSLIIGDGLGGSDADVVRETADNQIFSTVPITITNSGLLDLNNVNDAIGTLTFSGGRLTTGTGVANLIGDITANPNTNDAARIEGNVLLSATRTFDVAQGVWSPDLLVSAAISGAGGITKIGSGEMSLSASNTYAGLTTVSNGFLDVENSFALGSTNTGTVVSSGAVLGLLFGVNVGLEPLTLSGPGSSIFGALNSGFGSNSWAGAIALATNSTISVLTNDFLNLSGPISDAGTLTKVGPGTLLFSGAIANSYTNSTFVNEGTLLLGKSAPNGSLHGPLLVGDNVGGSLADVVRLLAADQFSLSVDLVVRGSGLLDLNGFSDDVENITLIGGNITTGSGTLGMKNNMTASSDSVGGTAVFAGNLDLALTRTITVTNGPSSTDLQFQAGQISGAGFIKAGGGFMVLASSNSFTGTLTINDGTVQFQNSFAAGPTNGGVIVNSNAILRLISNVHIGAETLTLNSLQSNGSVESISGSNSWAGNVILATNTIINVDAGDTLNLLGGISGSGTLTKIDTGTLVFSGTAANTYTNMTTVAAGTLLLNKPAANDAVVGDLTIGDGVGGPNADVVRLAVGSQIGDTSKVHISSSGLLELNGLELVGSIDGSGQVNLASLISLEEGNDNSSSTFTGLIVGAGSVFKFGTGTWTLTGNNTVLGPATVSAGTLVVKGSQPQTPVTVNASATLGGNGTVGDILVFGALAPGASPGVLTCSNLTFASSASDYFVELTGPTPGTDYDQMNVRGTNSLSNAVLHVTANFTKPVAVGQQFVIINNDGAESVTGTFNDLPNGSAISANGYTFTIAYGNDVTLTLTNVPAASVGSSVAAGNGNHAIDPNDCNNLSIIITNKSGSPMTGVSGSLSTSNDSVLVTQPLSAYPDIPANGRASNAAPFQISTLPNFGCGTNINLTLTLFSASHGDFGFPVVVPSGEPGNTPARYDNSAVTNIPDVGAMESTNLVSGFAGPLTKVTVSLYLTHTFDADLSISLINPDGVSIDLSSGNGGSGDDYGVNCAPDASRTTFDDSAATAITAGAAPFVGVFRPEVPLAAFNGGTANGNWRLRIADANGGSLGALRCWSLFLYPPVCAPGSGYCLTCPGVFSNAITAGDPAFTNRLFTTGVASSCGAPKTCPGINSAPGPFRFDSFTFTNTGPDACASVGLDTACGSMFAAAYLNNFDTNNLCANYLADIGANPPAKNSFSFSVPGGATFVVVVHAGAGATCGAYQLIVSGLPCPTPALAIEPTAVPQNVRLDWSTAAGGFNLEATPSLAPTNWTVVTNEPIVSAGRYNVTNSSPPTNRFYRLHKP